jgi:ABC-2 type transport system ATP-binding protein
MRRRGKTIFFSTHILGDVEAICDRVGMLFGGKLLAEGPLGQLLDGSIQAVELRCLNVPKELFERLTLKALRTSSAPDGQAFVFRSLLEANQAAKELLASGGQVLALQPIRETLEESFVRLARAEGLVST